MITLAFCNNKGGVGKTSLAAHLAWMFSERGIRVLTVDLDPQSNLSAMFLPPERLQELWSGKQTMLHAVQPLMEGTGDVASAHAESVAKNLHLIAGDLSLSRLEDSLAESWGQCLSGDVRSFRVVSSFYRVAKASAKRLKADVLLFDVGPNLGPLNRAALLGADNIVLPLAPDLFSLQGMENFGPTLREWRSGWTKRVGEARDKGIELPLGRMSPIGYVVVSFGVRDNRPVQAYDAWIEQIPKKFREDVLNVDGTHAPPLDQDPYRFAALKHYRSLMPMAMAAHKPMFKLKTAEGARGAHLEAVQHCYRDFFALAQRIGAATGLPVA